MMYHYRNPHMARNQRFIGFGLPFLGGLAGGLLGSALFFPRPFYGGYPGFGYPGCCGPGFGYPGVGYPGFGYPGFGYY